MLHYFMFSSGFLNILYNFCNANTSTTHLSNTVTLLCLNIFLICLVICYGNDKCTEPNKVLITHWLTTLIEPFYFNWSLCYRI